MKPINAADISLSTGGGCVVWLLAFCLIGLYGCAGSKPVAEQPVEKRKIYRLVVIDKDGKQQIFKFP